MAAPSVPEASNTKDFSDLTVGRMIQENSEFATVLPSIKIEQPNNNGYVVYPEGVLPNSLSAPFVRIRFKVKEMPSFVGGVFIGIMTNCDVTNEDGYYYGIYLNLIIATNTMKFQSGSIAFDADPIVPTPVDEVVVDAGDWTYMLDQWCYMDIHFGETLVSIYIYDSAGVLKESEDVDIQNADLGTVGTFLLDESTTDILPHLDDFYIHNVSPYD